MNRSRTLAIVLAAALCGCSGPADDPNAPPEFDGLEKTERRLKVPPERTRPLAFINGEPVLWGDLRLDLLEAQGAAALQDLILSSALERDAKRRGILITEEDVEHERTLLIENMAATVEPGEAENMLMQVRGVRGLGPARYEALLRRNALLRALVRDEVTVANADVQRAFEIVHGPRYRVRIIMCANETDTSRARREVLKAETPEAQRHAFIAQAVSESLDPSSTRGGLLEQISPADPSYPDAFIQMLSRVPPGEVSPLIALDNGSMLLWVEDLLPPDDTVFEDVEEQMHRDVRTGLERLAMDRLARRLVGAADVGVVDEHLKWSWDRRPQPQP